MADDGVGLPIGVRIGVADEARMGMSCERCCERSVLANNDPGVSREEGTKKQNEQVEMRDAGENQSWAEAPEET